jgi:hypothetical protein
MRNGKLMICGKAPMLGFRQSSSDVLSSNRVRTIQNNHSDTMRGRLLHRITESADVGVEASAYVLNVEDQSVDPLELFWSWPIPILALARVVQGIDRQAGRRVCTVGDRFVELSTNAVLRPKQSYELNARGSMQNIRRLTAVQGSTRVVRDQAHPASAQQVKAVSL